MLEEARGLPIKSDVVLINERINFLAVRALGLAKDRPLADAIETVCQGVQIRQAVMSKCERILILAIQASNKEIL
jgi:hypothetical protein